jgi:hypothetical protein
LAAVIRADRVDAWFLLALLILWVTS